MNNNPRLEGFNNLLELAIKENNLEFLEQFTPILSNFNESLEKNIKVDWSKVLDPGAKQNFIILGFKNNKKIENFFYFLKNQKS